LSDQALQLRYLTDGDSVNVDDAALLLGAFLGEERDVVLSAGLQFPTSLALAGRACYSPDILTFGSADNLVDLEARVEIRFAKRLVGFAGQRWFEMDLLMTQERELPNELFAGIRWELQ